MEPAFKILNEQNVPKHIRDWSKNHLLSLDQVDLVARQLEATRDITGHKRAEETPLNDDRTAVSHCKRSRRMSGNPQISFFASVGGAG